MLRDLPTDQITIRNDARVVDPATVSALADSIAAVGLINPIRVRAAAGDGWEVIAGVHRLAAHGQLGLTDIACEVVTDDDLHAELAMIDENLCRAELTPSDRARYMARRKALYQELHPETRPGGYLGHVKLESCESDPTPSFAAQVAAVTGKSEGSVYRDTSRGENIIPEVLELVRGTKLDTGSYLDRLKKLPPSEQMTAVKRDLAHLRQQERDVVAKARGNKIAADVKARAAREVADMLSEHVPGEWWDALKANLYAAGAANIAHELTNITGQSIMDRSAA